MTPIPPCPAFDYANWPASPSAGHRSGANYLTEALFVETTRMADRYLPLYSLSETESEWNGVWYPCARKIYLHSEGEHDFLVKLVGSFKHWLILKELRWFKVKLDLWQEEWRMAQVDKARAYLDMHASSKGGAGAARALFDDAKKGNVGRPRKNKSAKAEPVDADHSHDADRVVAFLRPQ